MAAAGASRVAGSRGGFMTQWVLIPECYPLFAAIGGGLVLCAFRLGHGLTHPEVRVAKEPRSGQDNMIEVDAPKDDAYSDGTMTPPSECGLLHAGLPGHADSLWSNI